MPALHAVAPPAALRGDRQPEGQSRAVRDYIADMRIAGYSPVTIGSRVELLQRFAGTVDRPLLDATTDDLRAFQHSVAHLAPASANIYSRHLKAFFDWAHGRELIDVNPAVRLTIPRVPKGRPHPTSTDDLRLIFACATGTLRLAYVLAALAGLRRGEICRLQRHDLDLNPPATALIHGKGGKERVVPLLAPVVAELAGYGLPRAGWVLRKHGRPYHPEALSIDSHRFLRDLGVESTLHSMRAAFATQAARVTRDPLLVRDLLGHESVATTEIYMAADQSEQHARLAGLAQIGEDLLADRRHGLRVIGGTE